MSSKTLYSIDFWGNDENNINIRNTDSVCKKRYVQRIYNSVMNRNKTFFLDSHGKKEFTGIDVRRFGE